MGEPIEQDLQTEEVVARRVGDVDGDETLPVATTQSSSSLLCRWATEDAHPRGCIRKDIAVHPPRVAKQPLAHAGVEQVRSEELQLGGLVPEAFCEDQAQSLALIEQLLEICIAISPSRAIWEPTTITCSRENSGGVSAWRTVSRGRVEICAAAPPSDPRETLPVLASMRSGVASRQNEAYPTSPSPSCSAVDRLWRSA